tara:strand:- start:1005 stop:1373 length:369 start_codon:yes stop_codon:yes gene_type:complete
MTLKVSELVGTAGTFKIVSDATSNATAEVNVTGGAGKLYSVDISVAGSSGYSNVKFKLTSGTATVGTTEPDLQLAVFGGGSERFDFPNGLSFDQITFWSTADFATSSTSNPANTTIVTLLTS